MQPREFRRDESLDIAKGFGIVLVVLGHVLDGLVAAHYFPPSVLWPNLAIYTIYLFHMPLFFVISGHLASGKFRPAGQTVVRMLPTIVYPYFLWSILEGLMLVYLGRLTNGHVPITSLYKILWIPIVPYWFLYALFFCHVGYLATRRLSFRVQLLVAVLVFLVPLAFLAQINHWNLLILLQTTRAFLFFTLGVITVAQVKQLGRWAAVVSTILFIVMAVAIFQAQANGPLGTIAFVPAAIAGIVATLAWSRLLAARSGWAISAVAFLGRYSMSIYVMHIFFTAGMRIALKRLASHPTVLATVIEVGAATVVGTLLPLGINWLISWFDLDKWFGLQHMEAR